MPRDARPFVTVIGRGHSGTRAMSHTLSASGVFMGSPLNESGDLLPPESNVCGHTPAGSLRQLAGRSGVGLE